jgi:Phasin protein
METKRRRSPRISATDLVAAGPPESPAEVLAQAPGTESTPDQQAAGAAGPLAPAEMSTEDAAQAPKEDAAQAPKTEATPDQQAAGVAGLPAPQEISAEGPAQAPKTETTPDQQAANGAPSGENQRLAHDSLAVLAESQAAIARCLEAVSDVMTALTCSGIDIAARTATDMLRVKTLSDACEVNAQFAQNSLDRLLDGSVELYGLGFKLAAEASRPILTQFGQGSIKSTGSAC